MDIFRLLSRSTKLSNRARPKDAPSLKLPSSGISADPQLYHDAVPDTRGKKRKRGLEKHQEETILDDEEVNYFAPKPESTEPREIKSSEKCATTKAPRLLDDNECRQTLRSHRIKITLLKCANNDTVKIKDSKKSRKVTKTAAAKDQHQQIYPQPLTDFSQLHDTYKISSRLSRNLANQGYKIPTEIQMASLPLLLQPEIAMKSYADQLRGSDVDLLAVAPTGSGKTLAFLIPIVNRVIQRRRQSVDAPEHILDSIVIAPTKELADQILNEAKKLSIGTGVKVTGMRKGMRIVETEKDTVESVISGKDEKVTDELDEGDSDEEDSDEDIRKKRRGTPVTKSDILVTTPGLLLSALATDTPLSFYSLPTVRNLVLDEADILLDPLFREQTLSIWSALTSPQLSISLWSATISSSIEMLAISTISSRPKSVKRPLIRLVIGLKDSALPTISHNLTYCATEPGKLLALRNLLHVPSSSSTPALRPPLIIFTQTIPRATALYSELLYDIPPVAGGSSRIAALHSSLSATARAAILERFRCGEIWVLVTTDLLSRGVDFCGVNAVVNYDIPNDAAGYIHRVGRTGRGGREGGVAVTFYTREDIPFIRGVVNVIEASRKAGTKLEGNVDGKDYSWLLNLLPKTSKEEKKKLKVRGVEARRIGVSDKVSPKDKHGSDTGRKMNMRIGTKSGYERKLQNRRRGAIEGSQRRVNRDSKIDAELDESEWDGIEE